MTSTQTGFFCIILCISMFTGIGYGKPVAEDTERKKPTLKHVEAEPSKHKVVTQIVKSSNIDVHRLRVLLISHVDDDEALRQNLEGGKQDRDIFKLFATRLVSLPFFIFYNPMFLLHFSLLTLGLGAFKSLCSITDIWLEDKNTPKVNNVLFFRVTNYHAFYAFCGLLFFLYKFWSSCKNPSYLMLAIQSKALSKEKKEEVCNMLIDVMEEKGMDFSKQGLMIEEHAKHISISDEHMQKIRSPLKRVYGEAWLASFSRYCKALLIHYGATRSCLQVKSVTALHLAYEQGLEKIIQRLEKISPASQEVGGYTFQDTPACLTREEINEAATKKQAWENKILWAMLSMFKLNVPYPYFWEQKKPAAFAPKK